jgi:hypothetical protein
MASTQGTKSEAIQIERVSGGDLCRLAKPGARYAVYRGCAEVPGVWAPSAKPLPNGLADTFSADEARLLLPLLRELDTRPSGKGGRKAAPPTTPDGHLVARACRQLGLTGAALAERIGAHESVLSRARHGELPEVHREAIHTLLRGGVTSSTPSSERS